MAGPVSFPQQGSVDWVELSSRSVQFSVAVIARLSKAGIDLLTLQVGRALCCRFSMHPAAQNRLQGEILKLKKYSSYGDVLWFGFGIKHIVSDLAETEEGLSLAGLCAALSATYDPLFVAQVLRELCTICKAPNSLTPALRQWKALADVCAGILSSGDFVLKLMGFRLLLSPPGASGLDSQKLPTTPHALANAVLILAQLSCSKLQSATITGGLDCAWLAAYAEWLLSLEVRIVTVPGAILYRSRQCSAGTAVLTIVAAFEPEKNHSTLLVKAYCVPGGRSLLHKDGAISNLQSMNWRTSWSTILGDAFDPDVGILLNGSLSEAFSTYFSY